MKSQYTALQGRKALLDACINTKSGSKEVVVSGTVVHEVLLLLEDLDPALSPAAALAPTTGEAAGPEWVSVEERLPYYAEVALVAAAHPLGGFSVLQRTFRYMGEEGWQRHDAKGGKSEKTITHWMPLPTAPVAPTTQADA
jgi:hypothetical protein